MKIAYYSQEPLTLHYTEDELLNKIREYISKLSDIHFSYLRLCNYILSQAEEDNKLGKKENTIYLNPELKPSDYSRISVALWQLIREGLICVDFYVNPYRGQMKDDTAFIIIRK